MRRIGIGDTIIDKMEPVQATVLGENNTLYRVCEHGIKHPVAHMDRPIRITTGMGNFADEHRSGSPLESFAQCDGCCAEWPKDVDAPVTGLI